MVTDSIFHSANFTRLYCILIKKLRVVVFSERVTYIIESIILNTYLHISSFPSPVSSLLLFFFVVTDSGFPNSISTDDSAVGSSYVY